MNIENDEIPMNHSQYIADICGCVLAFVLS